MPTIKTKKTKKSKKMRGKGMGTHGGGARKKRKKSGHRGGVGMAGSGKRGDQKKTLITKLYGHKYFGKRGITSASTKRDKRKRINLFDIELNLERYGKKSGDKWEITLKDYKILSGPKNYLLKNKLIIKAKEASQSAIEQVKKLGGEIIIPEKKIIPKKDKLIPEKEKPILKETKKKNVTSKKEKKVDA